MIHKLKKIYYDLPLASKIRYSYFLLLVPMVVFLVICFYNIFSSNRKYESMIDSAVIASDFSLDFKSDFDYETYLLIIGNKSVEESPLRDLLAEANAIVTVLGEQNEQDDNAARLSSAQKYLKNLDIYLTRIEENLETGGKYEENIEIWENDVQIVTSLLREAILQYIYYEIRDIQESREAYNEVYLKMINLTVFAFVVILGVLIYMSVNIPLSITRPIREISRVTDQVAKGNLNVRSNITSGAEVGVLSNSLNTMIDKIEELLEQVTNEQIRLRKAEFELLQSQINPHFLYNTLDTIVWLAESGDQKKVVMLTQSLSAFFRTSLNQGNDIISIKEELVHVRSYLEIQQVRYQDILEYEIAVPKELFGYHIPKITIQPLVENALYHGIKNKRGKGKILISGEAREDGFVLVIKDNGIGMTPERLEQVLQGIYGKEPTESNIYGLYNVNERIVLHYGEDYGIEIESYYGEGSEVIIHLPYDDFLSVGKN